MNSTDRTNGRVIIFDDHSLFSHTLDIALKQHGLDVERFDLSEQATVEDILAAAKSFQPDVVVLDLHLGTVISNARPLIPRLSSDNTQVIIVTADKDELQIAGCIFDGATCVLGKDISFEVFVNTILRVLSGEKVVPLPVREELIRRWKSYELSRNLVMEPFMRLTPREEEMLSALIAGKAADTIARESYMSVSTVRSHIHSILNKLEVRSQLEAVAKALHSNWTRTS